ncbi:hypothetical protein F5Y16DRAFT_414877 [Xylariaceae sp. FL0255]|nr:hypothetical protein F5Y16DRAFT_414877 [Xylariaceae sp. FL0255]
MSANESTTRVTRSMSKEKTEYENEGFDYHEDSIDLDYKPPKATLTHKLPPAYSPHGNKWHTPENLWPETYKPRDLLNYAARGFHGRQVEDLNIRQEDVQAKIIRAFAIDIELFGGPVSAGPTVAQAKRSMQAYLEHLDGFFFFGTLHEYIRLSADMDQVSERDQFSNKRLNSFTKLRIQKKTKKPFIRLHMNLGRDGKYYNIETLLGLLVRELTISWFILYSCTCDACVKDTLNTLGHPGEINGPMVLMLHRLIVTEIRRWRPEFKGFQQTDCPKDEVSRSMRESFELSIKSLDIGTKKSLNKRRNRTANLLIRLTHDNKVAVSPELKQKQLKKEDIEYLKNIRADERRKDQRAYDKVLEEEDKHDHGYTMDLKESDDDGSDTGEASSSSSGVGST